MPIDPSVAIGAALPDRSFSWTASDVLLYHLAIGAGSHGGDNLSPEALRYTYDDDQLQVLPSFGIVAPSFHETAPPSVHWPGCDLDLQFVVHGAQAITVARPLPTSGSATLRTTITDVWDKGRAAVIVQEGVASSDATGDVLWTVRSSVFARNEGGFGGDRGPSTTVALPERAADAETTYAVTPQQALLYRLCGDRNPLHADPAFAKGAGFPAPILHGLCSYGIVLREITDAMLAGDASRVAAFSAKFAGVVFPGETIRVAMWDSGNTVVAAATIDAPDSVAVTEGGRHGAPVLVDCVVTKA